MNAYQNGSRNSTCFSLLAAVIVLAITLFGCDAGKEVQPDNQTDELETLLSSIESKRNEITRLLKSLQSSIGRIRDAKNNVKVKRESIKQRYKMAAQQVESIDKTLKQLQGYLVQKKPVKLAGKTYDQKQFEVLAGEIIEGRKKQAALCEGFKKTISRMESVYSELADSQLELQKQMASLKLRIDDIDGKRIALESIKSAGATSEAAESEFEDNFANIRSQVDDLFITLEMEVSIVETDCLIAS